MNEKLKFGFIVEYVKDIEIAKKFYVETMGLQIEREHPTYIQFETFAIATDEPMGGEVKQEIYWLVNDINSTFNLISQKAEVCLSIQEVPFGKVFGVRDPDGHPCYILELATHRPSKEIV
ncbi:glyoxalase/bleomycin resistance/dioxygenase family protein [Arcobacter sp. KX21116]|uniref:VOC family protein n=1 Tax=Arcobacter iocasae TaxID=2906515 RepID=UPI0035D41EC9